MQSCSKSPKLERYSWKRVGEIHQFRWSDDPNMKDLLCYGELNKWISAHTERLVTVVTVRLNCDRQELNDRRSQEIWKKVRWRRGGGFKDRWWQGNKAQRRRIDSRWAAGSNVGLCRLWWPAVILLKVLDEDIYMRQFPVMGSGGGRSSLSALFEDFMVCCHRTKCVGGFLYPWPPSDALWSSSCLFFLLELLCDSDIQ